jgi:N-acyl-D-aspartate/D-glutamate deacylase
VKVRDLAPDLVLRRGRIYTLDAKGVVAEALAVKDGTILAIGSDDAVGALAGPATRQIDLHGRTAIPGFSTIQPPAEAAVSSPKSAWTNVARQR